MRLADSEYFKMNRDGWDQRAKAHFESKFYNVEGFLRGHTSLREIEMAELGSVAGKTMLHLQCHFGLDTLSWVREGAICTGVDISPVAIQKARELSEQTQINANFVCSDVYSFRSDRVEYFDIVFTSYGTICWLPDLMRWAEIIASNLKVGGTFYIADFHPVHDLLAGFSYFACEDPIVDESGSYTEIDSDIVTKLATWPHPISDVINALIAVGIRIQRVNEFPFSPYNCFEGMEEREPGRFYLSHKGSNVPIVFSILGQKVA